jgi:hypothetical protein
MPRDPSRWSTAPGASSLNASREEIIALFREGTSTAEISRRYGTGDTNVQRWLKAQGEYDRVVKCALEECAVEFPFRVGKFYCCRLHTKRADARNQSIKPENRLKIQARNRLNSALRSGIVERPSVCQRCGETPQQGKDSRTLLHADHYMGYEPDHRLTIQWICHDCDRDIEMLRKGRDDNRIQADERIGKWTVLAVDAESRRSVAKLRCRCVCGHESRVMERDLVARRSLGCVKCRQEASRGDVAVDETH